MRRTILIIEDDADIRALLVRFCERLGFQASVIAESRFFDASFDLAQQGAIVGVITDIFMPGKSGIEVIQEIKERTPHVKVLAISGGWSVDGSMNDALTAAQKLGVDAALPKPFTQDQLKEALAAAGVVAD